MELMKPTEVTMVPCVHGELTQTELEQINSVLEPTWGSADLVHGRRVIRLTRQPLVRDDSALRIAYCLRRAGWIVREEVSDTFRDGSAAEISLWAAPYSNFYLSRKG